MAKNLGREYATMSEDERRKFALEEEEGNRELPAELAFDDPRHEEHSSRQFATPNDEVADPEHRDGESADLDDEQHRRMVQNARSSESGAKENSRSAIDDA
jgi:hypothetical protein